MLSIAARVIELINHQTENADTITQYRKPLVGFASAQDPLFNQMKEIIGLHHLHPTELLLDAQTVISFFLPFAKTIITANRESPQIAREWAVSGLRVMCYLRQMCCRTLCFNIGTRSQLI